LEIWLGVKVFDEGLIVGALGVSEAGDCAILVEFDPFGWAKEIGSHWDSKVGDMVVIDCVAAGSCFESLLVVAYLLLQALNVLSELEVSESHVGFSLGDGG
jgi:hypothetical protein